MEITIKASVAEFGFNKVQFLQFIPPKPLDVCVQKIL